MIEMSAEEKLKRLREILAAERSVAIALSGGADSIFLTAMAAEVPQLTLMAVTAVTPYTIPSATDEAARFCREQRIDHHIVRPVIPAVVMTNPPERCYLCKKSIMKKIVSLAQSEGFMTIIDGTNASDQNEYRPGIKALHEGGVRSPLAEAGLTKEEIRMLARKHGLRAATRASDTCLLTRFPGYTLVTEKELLRVAEAESIVAESGFNGARVRIHGEVARLELTDDEFMKMAQPQVRKRVAKALKQIGYRYVAIDAIGYISGSMESRGGEEHE